MSKVENKYQSSSIVQTKVNKRNHPKLNYSCHLQWCASLLLSSWLLILPSLLLPMSSTTLAVVSLSIFATPYIPLAEQINRHGEWTYNRHRKSICHGWEATNEKSTRFSLSRTRNALVRRRPGKLAKVTGNLERFLVILKTDAFVFSFPFHARISVLFWFGQVSHLYYTGRIMGVLTMKTKFTGILKSMTW